MSQLFDTGFGLDGSAPANDTMTSRKRKRPTEASAVDKDSMVAAANINVDLLLSKLRASEKSAMKSDKPSATPSEASKREKGPRPAKGKEVGKAERGRVEKRAKAVEAAIEETKEESKEERKRRKKVKKRDEAPRPAASAAADDAAPVKESSAAPSSPERPSAPLPPSAMQAQMREKLGGARFRWINEQLVRSLPFHIPPLTLPSTPCRGKRRRRSWTTTRLSSPKYVLLFRLQRLRAYHQAQYHVGFRSQSDRWPVHPLHLITADLKTRPFSTLIADLGCGDATLARSLQSQSIRVLSYDLVADRDWVVRAQCSEHVPLPSSVVDVVVCCLSLMGRDWVGMIKESHRILVEECVARL